MINGKYSATELSNTLNWGPGLGECLLIRKITGGQIADPQLAAAWDAAYQVLINLRMLLDAQLKAEQDAQAA